jgi:hypothetical protein
LYLESGSGDVVLDKRIVPILPPAIVTVPAGVNHGFRFSRDVKGLVLTILNTHLVLSTPTAMALLSPRVQEHSYSRSMNTP